MDDPLFGAPAEPPLTPALVTINRRLMTVDAQGNPTVSIVPMVTKAAMQDLYNAAVALPFEAPDPADPNHKFDGMTCAEVMVRKQVERAARSGEPGEVTDRIMGKPKQTSESVKVSVTYEQWLKQTAQRMASEPFIEGEKA